MVLPPDRSKSSDLNGVASISSFFTYQPTGQYFGSIYAVCQEKYLNFHIFIMLPDTYAPSDFEAAL
jgi:hypothetical protein